MKPKLIGQLVTDICMTVLLFLLMAFELIGRMAHEWIGIGIFVLFLIHHILNWSWNKSLLRGKYTPFQIFQTVVAALTFVMMLGCIISAVLISRYVFSFLPIHSGRSFGRVLHMFCVYWFFIISSLHLGVNWNRITGTAARLFQSRSHRREKLLRVIGTGIALYGIYAFVRRGIPGYLFLQIPFAFFDFQEPLLFFLLDYAAVTGTFVWIGNYLGKATRRLSNRKQE